MSRNPFSRYEVRAAPATFPSKFSALPGISDSPTPNEDNQLLPYKSPVGRISQLRGNGVVTQGEPGGDPGDERVRQLESRINVAEKSNRALLEEVVRLQSELRSTVKRNEELIRDDRGSRAQLENSLRANNEVVNQLVERLKRTEDKVQEEHAAVVALATHSKNIEQSILGSQQELISRREMQNNRLSDLQSELEETRRGKDSVERVLFSVVDELRQLRGRVDTQGLEFNTTVSDLRNRSKRLEDDARASRMDNMRKQGETQSISEQHNSQLKSQIETRLSELRDVMVELRNRQDSETQERRLLEQQTQIKMTDLQATLSEQTRQHEASVHALDVLRREREHLAETERIKLQGKIAEVAEEVIKKVLTRETKIREENANKFSQIEQAMNKQAEEKLEFEKRMRAMVANEIEDSRRNSSDDVKLLHEKLKTAHKKQRDTLHELNDSMALIEKQFDEMKKRQDKLLSAEIHARKSSETESVEKIRQMEEKLSVATSTLQQAVNGLSSQMTNQENRLRQDLKEMLEENQDSGTRSLADLDARLTSLNAKIASAEDALENKISTIIRQSQMNPEAKELEEAATVQSKNIREQMESIVLSQSVTQQTIKELQLQVTKTQEQVFGFDEKHKLLKSELDARMTAEADTRLRDIENIREELKGLDNKLEELEKKKLDRKETEEIQESIKKLAESIQTMKTVLGMKIQSEQKLRQETMTSLQNDVIRLRTLVEPLLRNKPDPRVFIKPSDGNSQTSAEIERASRVVNKWGIYTAYKWQHWKQKWMYMKWAKEANRGSSSTNRQSRQRDTPTSPQQPADAPEDHQQENDDDAVSNGDVNLDDQQNNAADENEKGDDQEKENKENQENDDGDDAVKNGADDTNDKAKQNDEKQTDE